MFKAQLHSKLPSHICNLEDILSSDVFSFFYYSDREFFLYRFLNVLGMNVNVSEAKAADFIFWPRFEENTEPDLVLIVGNYYLLIESKFRSDFGNGCSKTKPQLEREISGGQHEAARLNKKFILLTITRDIIRRNEKFESFEEQFNIVIYWINWQFISELITELLNSDYHLDRRDILIAEDLLQTLDKKGLRNYIDLNKVLKCDKNIKSINSLFIKSETIVFRGDFIGFTHALPCTTKLKTVKTLFYKKNNKIFFDLIEHQQIPNHNNLIFFKSQKYGNKN